MTDGRQGSDELEYTTLYSEYFGTCSSFLRTLSRLFGQALQWWTSWNKIL